jgi:hypothetical protein
MALEDQKKAVENELAQKRQTINNSLNVQKFETDNTINRNNQYLDEQIKKMNTDKIVNDDKIAALQNRRGGFYSGGLDYQLAENLRNTTEGQTGLRRDTGTKNQELLGRYNLLASQAAEQIKQLEMESADTIRALVNAELERQAAAARSRASSTTTRQSTSTPVAQQFRADQSASQKSALDKYYESQSRLLNAGRSVARRKLEDIYPGTIPAPKDNKNLSLWERNKLIIDSMSGK